jgi:hypothetical protein
MGQRKPGHNQIADLAVSELIEPDLMLPASDGFDDVNRLISDPVVRHG